MLRKIIFIFIPFTILLVSCSNIKSPVSITLQTEDENAAPLTGGPVATLVVAQADTAQGLIDALEEKLESEENTKLYSSVINKLAQDSIPIYYTPAYTSTSYSLTIYQKDEQTGLYLPNSEIDVDKPYILDITCSFYYDGDGYKLIYSTEREPSSGFEATASAGGATVTIYGNVLPNGVREARAFTISGEENMFISALSTNTTFLGESLPESDEDIALPEDFFAIDALYVESD